MQVLDHDEIQSVSGGTLAGDISMGLAGGWAGTVVGTAIGGLPGAAIGFVVGAAITVGYALATSDK